MVFGGLTGNVHFLYNEIVNIILMNINCIFISYPFLFILVLGVFSVKITNNKTLFINKCNFFSPIKVCIFKKSYFLLLCPNSILVLYRDFMEIQN
jgi:hypothetical protein